jgi:hypothetical protein
MSIVRSLAKIANTATIIAAFPGRGRVLRNDNSEYGSLDGGT